MASSQPTGMTIVQDYTFFLTIAYLSLDRAITLNGKDTYSVVAVSILEYPCVFSRGVLTNELCFVLTSNHLNMCTLKNQKTCCVAIGP